MRQVQVAITETGGRAFRNNVGLFYTKTGEPVKCGLLNGSADLIGWYPVTITDDMVGRHVAVFLSCEVKRPGEKPRDDQVTWMQNVIGAGGIAYVATSPEEGKEGCRWPVD
jgi:hypothetical protein